MDGGMRGIEVFFRCTITGNHRRRLGAHPCKHTLMKQSIDTNDTTQALIASTTTTRQPISDRQPRDRPTVFLRRFDVSPPLWALLDLHYHFQDGGLVCVCGLMCEGMLVVFFVVVDALLYGRNADFPAVDTRFPAGRCHLTVDRAMPGR